MKGFSPDDKTIWKNERLQSEIFTFRKHVDLIKI